MKNTQKQKRLLKRKKKKQQQIKMMINPLKDNGSNNNINNSSNNNSNSNNNNSNSSNNKINSNYNNKGSNYGSLSENNFNNNHFDTEDNQHDQTVRGGNYQNLNVHVDPSSHDHHVDPSNHDHHVDHSNHENNNHIDHHYSDNSLSNNEINLITGILQLSQATIQSIMIPLKKVFMLSSSLHLDKSTLSDILHSGYSRILIYHKHDHHYLQGYILVKELISLLTSSSLSSSSSLISSQTKLYYSNSDVGINYNNNSVTDSPPILECTLSSSSSLNAMNITTTTTMITDICNIRIPLFVKPDVKLLDMLTIFQTNHCHLAVITSNPSNMLSSLQHQQHQSHHHHDYQHQQHHHDYHHHQYHCSRPSNDTIIYGIITLEDVIERLIQHDITDESDIWRKPNIYPITMRGGGGGEGGRERKESDVYMKPGSVIKKIKLKMLHKHHHDNNDHVQYNANDHHYVHVYHNDTTVNNQCSVRYDDGTTAITVSSIL